jgi:hypothetical protein
MCTPALKVRGLSNPLLCILFRRASIQNDEMLSCYTNSSSSYQLLVKYNSAKLNPILFWLILIHTGLPPGVLDSIFCTSSSLSSLFDGSDLILLAISFAVFLVSSYTMLPSPAQHTLEAQNINTECVLPSITYHDENITFQDKLLVSAQISHHKYSLSVLRAFVKFLQRTLGCHIYMSQF